MKSRFVLPTLIVIGLGIILFLPADAFAEPVNIDELDKTCILTQLKNCKVLTSGYLNSDAGDTDGEPLFAWQTQSGYTDIEGILGGFVLFQYEDEGWTLFDSGFDAYRFEPPRLAAEQTILHVPGYTGGTGAYNTDRLYVWGDTGAAVYKQDWARIDTESWRDNIAPKLPKDTEIWKGVDFNFSDFFYGELSAQTPLWRPDDGNCCPSGGWAIIRFEIENKSLVVTSVDLLPPHET